MVKLEETVEGGETCKRHILTHKNTTKGKVGLNMRVERERAKGRYGDNIDNYMTRTTQLSFVCSLACSFSCFSLFSFLFSLSSYSTLLLGMTMIHVIDVDFFRRCVFTVLLLNAM